MPGYDTLTRIVLAVLMWGGLVGAAIWWVLALYWSVWSTAWALRTTWAQDPIGLLVALAAAGVFVLWAFAYVDDARREKTVKAKQSVH